MLEAILEAVFRFLAELLFYSLPKRGQVGCASLILLSFIILFGWLTWQYFQL